MKVSRSYHIDQLRRQVYWGKQCSDADGPKMPPITLVVRILARGIRLIVVKPTMTIWQVQILHKLGEDTMPLAAATTACPVFVLLLMGLMILRLTKLLTSHQSTTTAVVSPVLRFARSYRQLKWRCVREKQSIPSW